MEFCRCGNDPNVPSEKSIKIHGDPVTEVAKDHYNFQKGSLQVNIHTCDETLAGEISGDGKRVDGAVQVASCLIAFLLVVITFAIRLSSVIVPAFDKRLENQYLLFLYVLGSIVCLYFLAPGVQKTKFLRFAKSNKTSNQWLKWVIAVFGLAILIRDTLQLMTAIEINPFHCQEFQVQMTMRVFNLLYVLSQIAYIFRYWKSYIYHHAKIFRIGLMLLMACNLSNWLSLIIHETELALKEHEETFATPAATTAQPTQTSWSTSNTSTDAPPAILLSDEIIKDPCTCSGNVCQLASTAEKFIFPFAIEFTLVASTILFLIWKNIGRRPPPYETIIKPRLRFFQSYIGVGLGCLCVFTTIAMILFLATNDNAEDEIFPFETAYEDNFEQLLVHNSFLIGVEVCMIAACAVAFYYFNLIKSPFESAEMLDVVLLSVCLLGPLGLDLFGLAAIIGGDSKTPPVWCITAIQPLIDVIQCLLQFALICFGLQREPMTSENEAAEMEKIRRSVNGVLADFRRKYDEASDTGDEDEEEREESSGGRRCQDCHRGSVPSFLNALATYQPRRASTISIARVGGDGVEAQAAAICQHRGSFPSLMKALSNQQIERRARRVSFVAEQIVPLPEVSEQPLAVDDEDAGGVANSEFVWTLGDDDQSSESNSTSFSAGGGEISSSEKSHRRQQHSMLKVVLDAKIARPDARRLRLRNAIVFLLAANACMWAFLSLDGTAFETYPYQTRYYGPGAWTALTMIFRPLGIFFRMHSAGCLFEIWSYA